MNPTLADAPVEQPFADASELARKSFLKKEGRPLFLSNWERVLFIHYAIDPRVLQPHVPFELDLHGGCAWVSLVAFTMTDLRPYCGGRLGEIMFRPFREQRFLNLRTYVRHGDDVGIFFLAEWMSDWLCVQLGPVLYGLPYRWGRFDYRYGDHVECRVTSDRRNSGFHCKATLEAPETGRDDRDAFLLERYTAFTWHSGPARLFRIWHEPWAQQRVAVEAVDDSLITEAAPWFASARLSHANYSPGAFGIWMGRPRLVPERV